MERRRRGGPIRAKYETCAVDGLFVRAFGAQRSSLAPLCRAGISRYRMAILTPVSPQKNTPPKKPRAPTSFGLLLTQRPAKVAYRSNFSPSRSRQPLSPLSAPSLLTAPSGILSSPWNTLRHLRFYVFHDLRAALLIF